MTDYPDRITAKRHQRNCSTELLDATLVMTQEDGNPLIFDAVGRLLDALRYRFAAPDISAILSADPGRKTALRFSIQVIDEGASDSEIRKLQRMDLEASDEFVERERPKLLAAKSPAANDSCKSGASRLN